MGVVATKRQALSRERDNRIAKMEQILAKAAAADASIGQALMQQQSQPTQQVEQPVNLQDVPLGHMEASTLEVDHQEVREKMKQSDESFQGLSRENGVNLVASVTQLLMQQLSLTPSGSEGRRGGLERLEERMRVATRKIPVEQSC